jgi:Zn-dependent protease
VLIVVAQESVPASQLGTATATIAVFRSVGGVLGTAVLGAVFAGSLTSRLGGLAIIRGLGSEITPRRLARLAPTVRQEVIAAYSSTIQDLLLIAAPTFAVVLVLTLLLPNFPLGRPGRGRR